jgi:O-antigen biosynthesis protein
VTNVSRVAHSGDGKADLRWIGGTRLVGPPGSPKIGGATHPRGLPAPVEPHVAARPAVRARYLELDGEKQYIRGVTYGTFRGDTDGVPYPDAARVGADFAAMAAAGVNAVRLYDAPPRWLLDLCHENGLVAMVGLAWEQHVAFLDERRRAARIVRQVERATEACAGHPSVLCYAIGNEIPSSIVRWHGARKIERFLERLASTVKDVDPDGLVTYANYPTTEYLDLPSLDLVSFNIYLDAAGSLRSYLARLHNLAGDRPLLVTELGLDSLRHGTATQARQLEQQLRAVYASGSAGAFVFSWTDEWHRGGRDIDDWRFGLVDEQRRPKPALAAALRAFADVPTPRSPALPRISVVVCTHNGEATIERCLDATCRLDYPEFEVIVVDDGSTDRTAELTERFDVRLISTENRGLSAARNTGIEAASGDLVAFTDDDAFPDPHWLRYLANGFATSNHVGLGGPNVPSPDAGLVEQAVAHGPGGPIHVLLSDEVAEHVPGCNMAFRRSALFAVDGFDPQFRVAGDDVDMCWRLQERGWTIGFTPAAVVVHRRRRSIRGYLKQQSEYGKAEALLERKWPARYNRSGHLSWAGRVYGGSLWRAGKRGRIGYGTWGTNLFQSVYDRTPSTFAALPSMPEWYLLLAGLAALATVAAFAGPLVPWTEGAPVRVEPLLLAGATALLVLNALRGARASTRRAQRPSFPVHAVTIVLFALQPAARLAGRLRYGLTPWRRRGDLAVGWPLPRTRSIWSEHWRPHSDWVAHLERDLLGRCMAVVRGGEFDRWDIHVRVGPLAAARVHVAVEEHGQGRQLVRVRVRPRWSRLVPVAGAVLGVWLARVVETGSYLALAAAIALSFLVFRAAREAGAGVALVLRAIEGRARKEDEELTLYEELLAPVRNRLLVVEATEPAEQHG